MCHTLLVMQHRFIVHFPIVFGLALHNIPSLGRLMKSIGADFCTTDVNHIRGMQYQVVLNITIRPELN